MTADDQSRAIVSNSLGSNQNGRHISVKIVWVARKRCHVIGWIQVEGVQNCHGEVHRTGVQRYNMRYDPIG